MRGDAVEGEDDVVPAPAGLDRGADGFAGHVRRLPFRGKQIWTLLRDLFDDSAHRSFVLGTVKDEGPEACVFADRTQVPCEATPGDMVVVDIDLCFEGVTSHFAATAAK